jgi:hypothetical protein
MKKLVLALGAIGLLAGSAPSFAAAQQCRDKNGKFIKCPPKPAAKTATKPKMCRDAKGHFSKCK